MKIVIKPHITIKDPRNQVTTSNIFKKNQRKVSDKYIYDEDGLFSPLIFGKIGVCECGELHDEGWCKLCGTRVVDPNNMPDFFIDLGVRLPKLFVDYEKYKEVRPLLEYKAILCVYEDNSYEIVDQSEEDIEYILLNKNVKILTGEKAAKHLYPDIDKWLDKNTTDVISVPHPITRPNLKMDNGQITFSPLNKLLISVLKNLELIQSYKYLLEDKELDDPTVQYFTLGFYSEIYDSYIECMKEIFKEFAGKGKTSFLGSDLRSHRVTGAIKGTVINRFDIDEDIVLIGDTFIQTLYPYLYKLYEGDMQKINQHLIMSDAKVLVNRAPTICHLSIMALKPRIASCYKYGTFDDGGDFMNYQSLYDDENDTIGLRTIAINPIITDGIAGDFDGDSLLIIALYSDDALKEADTMLPSKNYMNYANGTIRNKIPEDIEFAHFNKEEK